MTCINPINEHSGLSGTSEGPGANKSYRPQFRTLHSEWSRICHFFWRNVLKISRVPQASRIRHFSVGPLLLLWPVTNLLPIFETEYPLRQLLSLLYLYYRGYLPVPSSAKAPYLQEKFPILMENPQKFKSETFL